MCVGCLVLEDRLGNDLIDLLFYKHSIVECSKYVYDQCLKYCPMNIALGVVVVRRDNRVDADDSSL